MSVKSISSKPQGAVPGPGEGSKGATPPVGERLPDSSALPKGPAAYPEVPTTPPPVGTLVQSLLMRGGQMLRALANALGITLLGTRGTPKGQEPVPGAAPASALPKPLFPTGSARSTTSLPGAPGAAPAPATFSGAPGALEPAVAPHPLGSRARQSPADGLAPAGPGENPLAVPKVESNRPMDPIHSRNFRYPIEDVRPHQYRYTLTLNVPEKTFAGSGTIALNLAKPAREIILHSAGLEFVHPEGAGHPAFSFRSRDGRLWTPESVETGAESETVRLRFAGLLPEGKGELEVHWRGHFSE